MAQTPLLQSSVRSSLGLLLAVTIAGIVGYRLIEGWSWLDSAWMVFITFTTIGYGEIHPLSDIGRVFTLGLIVSGLSVGTYATTRLTQAVFEGDLPRFFRERELKKRMESLDKHFIVIGYGRLGSSVVRELHEAGERLCVIERDEALAEQARLEVGAVLQGDGGDDELLTRAGLARARGVAITVPSAADAIYITMTVRQLNPTVAIQTRVGAPGEAIKARKAGATAVVSPHVIGGWKMAHGLIRPHTSSLLDLAMLAEHPDVHLDEFEVLATSPWAGLRLKELPLGGSTRVLVVAIRRADGTMIAAPEPEQRVEPGDFLIAIGDPRRLQTVEQQLGVRP